MMRGHAACQKVVTNKGALNGTARFLWGGNSDWQCLEERDSGGDLVARYTYSPGYIDAVAVQERDLNSDDDFGDANEVVYYHSNTLFSVYALSDADENVVERYRYDANVVVRSRRSARMPVHYPAVCHREGTVLLCEDG